MSLFAFEKQALERLQGRYNPENDIIPGAPDVTYSDHTLLESCVALIEEVEQLRERVTVLEEERSTVKTLLSADHP